MDSVILVQSGDNLALLRELITRNRERRGVVVGITPQQDTANFGWMGQWYENLIHFGEDHPSTQGALEDPQAIQQLLEIAEKERDHPELFCD